RLAFALRVRPLDHFVLVKIEPLRLRLSTRCRGQSNANEERVHVHLPSSERTTPPIDLAAPPRPRARPAESAPDAARPAHCSNWGEEGAQMNAIELLETQHRDVDSMLALLETGDRNQKLFDDLADLLAIHTNIEEQHFYPSVKAV